MQPFPGGPSDQPGPSTFCSSCGLANPPQARFCVRCGYPLIHQSAPHTNQGMPAPTRPATPPYQSPHPLSPPPPNQWVPAPPQPAPIAPPPPPGQARTVSKQRPSTVSQPVATAPRQFPGNLAELWWVRIPVALRRYSLSLSEIWHDGLYLTAIPLAALILPVLMFLYGAVEGFTHWTFITGPFSSVDPAPLAPFTELLPLMIVTVSVGALSANLGLMIVLGYALGDILSTILAPHNYFFAAAGLYNSPQAELLYIYVPHLVSYLIFCLLAVMPTLIARYLTIFLRRWIPLKLLLAFLQTALGAFVVGTLVYAWTQAAPLMIRVYWGWGWNSPLTQTLAMYFLQQPDIANQIVQFAVIAFAVRGVLTYLASWSKPTGQRAARLIRGLKGSDAHPTFLRRLPSFIRALLSAGVTTLLLGGIFGYTTECLITFLFLWLVLVVRGTLLPLFGFWSAWASLLNRVPVVARLAAALLIIYFPAMWLVNAYYADWGSWKLPGDGIGTFEAYLFTIGISVIVITVLIPQVKPAQVPPRRQPVVKPA